MLEENYQKENNEKEIENLKEKIKEQEKEIEELKEGLEKSKNDRPSIIGEGSDQEKIEKLLIKLKEYKNESETNQELIKILKEDHKNMKMKLNNFETFGGRIQDYNEFIKLFNLCLKDYKPKKKEQKEALEKLKEHLKKELD